MARSALQTIAILLAGVIAVGCQQRERETRAQQVDLLASVNRAEKRPSAEAITTTIATLDGPPEPAIDVPAMSRIVWTVRMPDHAVLRTAVGASPQMTDAMGARAIFRIGISDERAYDELSTTEVSLGSAHAWSRLAVDLSKYSGFKWSLFYRPREKTWNVIFNTTIQGLGRPVTPADRLLWARPLIVGTGPAWGLSPKPRFRAIGDRPQLVRQSGADMEDPREVIRQFILKTYLPGESPDNLRDDTPLLTSGILDSLAALGLAAFVQERFGVELDVYETSVERFNRIQDIAASIQRRQAPGAGQTGGAAR